MTTTRTHRTSRAAALALAAALAASPLLGACGVVPDRAQTDSSAGTGSPAADDDGSQDPTDGSSTPAGGSDGGGSDAVQGSSTGQHAADPNDDTSVPLRLDVMSVQRVPGDAVEVRFTVTNTGDAATFEPWSTMADGTIASGANYDVGGAVLIDLPADRKYLTLIDSDDVCLCTTFSSAGSAGIAPGESFDLYAQFPAPPESTTAVDFSLPGFSPVAGLEIG